MSLLDKNVPQIHSQTYSHFFTSFFQNIHFQKYFHFLKIVHTFQTNTLCSSHHRKSSYSTITDPSPDVALVQSDPSVLAGSWTGHTDAVWGLAYSGIKNRLLSCSADGTVKLWNPTEKNPCISTFNTNKGEDGEPPPPPEDNRNISN